MADQKIVKEWLDKAEEDYQFAVCSLDGGSRFLPQICFHLQQSAEKCLKAFIVAHGLDLRKIHNLPALLLECAEKDGSLLDLKEDCVRLTDYYIEPRYPTAEGGEVTPEEAEEARRAAQNIRNEIRKRLGL